MKKQLLLLLCFFSICAGYGQKILIPYRLGSKFGLSDEKGKIILKPQYESINYIDKDFFCAATPKAQPDGKKAAYNDDNNSYSLLKGTVVMLENQQYPNFLFMKTS